MQMYQVSFQTHYEDSVDVGKVLVTAGDESLAVQSVAFHLDLPRSQTVFNVSKIKPAIYQLDRHEIVKHRVARSHNATLEEHRRFVLAVTAGIRAGSEAHAWRRLGQSIIDRSSANRAIVDKSITEFEMTCEASDLKPRTAAIAKQAIYKEHRLFPGGAARPR